MNTRLCRALAAALTTVALLAGCAQTRLVPPDARPGAYWTGRLVLQVQDSPNQSFSAGFELKGEARAGELTLLTPLGGTAALLRWTPGSATLQSEGREQRFESVDALVAQATGAAIPVIALFDWLAGTNTPVPGWQADLSRLGEGRLQAQRTAPPPAANLRVVLDR